MPLTSSPRRSRALALAMLLALLLSAQLSAPRPALAAPAAPPNFQVEPVLTGLKNPIDFAFAPDGRVFVAEKAGLIKVYDSLADSAPEIFADLQANVYKGPNDHGILGLELDPSFASKPYVYVLYTYDGPIGGAAPAWNDLCADPPGPGKNGCPVSGRLARLPVGPNQLAGAEQVLVEGWCQQYTSHSVGALGFGADGALYASAGEGANTSSGDYGQLGSDDLAYTAITPLNPCGDPPAGVGVRQSLPGARGGALRAQSLRRPAGEPALLNGTIIRVDPDTGAGMPDNPLASSADANARRVLAYGLRNPFRFTMRPGTSEVWIGDVGWARWEEIDRIAQPPGSAPLNFGWPCYEGTERQPVYDGFNLTLCESLYATPGGLAAPYFAYSHRSSLQPGDGCSATSSCTSAISGLAFYPGGSYPASYAGALFFADYSRHGIWSILAGPDGLPDPATLAPFVTGATAPVSLRVGPGGDLFYADITGTLFRVRYFGGNQPPTAVALASPASGAAPLAVAFDGRASSDPEGGALAYAWDLDGDGQFDDAAAGQAGYTYAQAGSYTARLRVTDSQGASASASVQISAGNTPPIAVIDAPAAGTRWRVGDTISFSGHADDPQQGQLPGGSLEWSIVLHHCYQPNDCHEHLAEELAGAGGTLTAENHEDLPVLELRLAATDAGGLSHSTSVLLNPITTTLALRSSPAGLALLTNTDAVTTPADLALVVGSSQTLTAPAVQAHRSFVDWSDSVASATRQVTLGAAGASYSATYVNHPPTAAFSASVSSGAGARTAALNATSSADAEGDSLSYAWDFGDGASGAGAQASHTYALPGSYTVTLTVRDQLGVATSASKLVRVGAASLPNLYVWLPVARR